MTIDEFLNKTVKTGVDYDGAYGAQCVDLFRQYAKDVLNIPKHTGSVDPDGAKALWLNYENLPVEMDYFEKKRANSTPVQGDVAVWDGTPGNKYGHVAIVICAWGKDKLLVYEQDGTKKLGQEGYGARFKLRSKYNLLGYLRRK